MKSKHFAGLDGLRFISIIFVVLHHLFTFKTNFGFHGYDYPVLGLIGFYGIQFFFMGSGFLITYLLLTEQQRNGIINLKNFFIRRILRIWPAYYLLIILALVVVLRLPFFRIAGITDSYLANDPQSANRLFFFFLPHIESFNYPTAPYVHHTYTIGIEEQFYFIWGLLFFFFFRYAYRIFIVLIIVMPVLNFLHHHLYLYMQNDNAAPKQLQYVNSVITFLKYSRPSTFAIGALFGWAYFHQKGWVQQFKKVPVQLLVYAVLTASIFFKIEVPFVHYEYISVIMGCVMLIGTFKKESIINYSAGWISYLGKISYGIYLFHIFAIVFACQLVRLFYKNETSFGVTLILCLLTLLLSIIFGALSYHAFESYFLKLKQRFRGASKEKFQKSIKDISANEN